MNRREYSRGYRAADHDRRLFGIAHVRSMAALMKQDALAAFNVGYQTYCNVRGSKALTEH